MRESVYAHSALILTRRQVMRLETGDMTSQAQCASSPAVLLGFLFLLLRHYASVLCR